MGFQAELCGWRCLGLYWMRCVFPESITVWLCFYSHKPFCTAHGLLPGCSPLPTEGRGCAGWSVLVYLSPLLPIFTFPGYQQKYFLSMAALFCVFCCGTHPLLSLFSSLTACKVLKLQVIVNFVPQQPRDSCWGLSAPAVSQLWFLKPVLAWGGVGSGLCC